MCEKMSSHSNQRNASENSQAICQSQIVKSTGKPTHELRSLATADRGWEPLKDHEQGSSVDRGTWYLLEGGEL